MKATPSLLVFAATVILTVSTHHALGQARWLGGDGNWTDASWRSGSGPGGLPGSGQTISFTNTAGVVSVTTDLIGAPGPFGMLSQRGGTLSVRPGGRIQFAGDARVAEGSTSTATLLVAGELQVDGELGVGYGNGDGAGNANGTLAIEGSAAVRVGGNLDTWWDPGAQFIVTGGNADIEVGGTFFLGTQTTMTANINSNTFSTVKVLGNVNIAGGNGTLNVQFVDDYRPTLGTSWVLFDTPARGGIIPNVNFPDLGTGALLSVNYSEGGNLGQVITLDFTNTLDLKVNKTSGAAWIENPMAGGDSLDIDGYIIRSASGSLVKDAFSGLGRPGWAPGLPPSQSNNLLSETNFNSSTMVVTGASLAIGNVFNAAGSADLEFEFHVSGGETLRGTVTYVGGVTGDYNGDGVLTAADLDLLGAAIRAGSTDSQFDLDGSGVADNGDLLNLVNVQLKSWVGDANLDREFNSGDLVAVFQAGQYEDPIAGNSTWATGDWNQDQEFDTGDLVFAFQAGGFEQGPRAMVAHSVPEPSTLVLLLLALAWKRRAASA